MVSGSASVAAVVTTGAVGQANRIAVSGVGVDRQADALAGQLAAQLAAITGRPVQWQALGRNGADAQACLQDLLPQVLDQRWDLALLVLGVNDTTHLTSRRQWRTRLACLLAGLSSCSVQVGVTAVPPLGRFTALPQPLRQVAARQHALYLPLDLSFESAYLARDDFHPSAAGYREWAAGIARQWAPLVLPGAEPSLSSVEVGT